jgi:hypothetical protein
METFTRPLVLALSIAAGVTAAFGQTVDGPGDDVLCSGYAPPHLFTVDQWRARPEDKFPRPSPLPQPGHRWPHSYRQVNQELRILPDGTRLCGVPDVRIFYIDSAGRMRDESSFAVTGPDGKPAPTRARIEDPVAGTLYYLDLVKHTAYRLHPPAFRPLPPVDRAARQPLPAIEENEQNLGTHQFEGFAVEGTLHTSTATPPGGSLPISVTAETWIYRGEIPTALLTKSASPAMQHTTALLNFSTAEPDPALFRVPEGWSVVEGEVRERGLIVGARTSYDYVVQEAPYSAERITERPNVSLSTRTEEAPVKFYRDSAGRTRVDQEQRPAFPEITDTVDGRLIVLDPVHRVAHRFALGQMEQSPRVHAFAPATPHGTKSSTSDLGEDTMEGIPVSGELCTWRTPAGAAGNDREFTQSSESWYSTKLKLILLEKIHSTTDDTVIRLTHVSQEEPDHSLFEIPPGYTVVDEKGPLRISVVQP